MDQPIVYAADVGKGGRRVGGLIVFISSPIGILVLLLSVAVGADTLAMATVLTAGASLVAGAVVSFLGRSVGKADWLRLDSRGLELVRRGESRRWLWSDVSGIGRSGPLNPASAVRGRAIVLRVVHDGRGAGHLQPETVVIGNSYLTPISEIEGTLRDLHGRAESGSRRAAGTKRGHTDRPDVFLDRDAARKSAARASGRRRTIVYWVLGAGATSAAALYAVVGWPPDWLALAELIVEYELLRSVVAGGVMAGLLSMQFTDAMGEFLMLSSDGLHLRHKGQRGHWRWQDLQAFRLVGGKSAKSGDNGTGIAIRFLARGDGTDAKVKSGAPASEYAIENIYDTPLADIVRRIEVWNPPATPAKSDPPDLSGTAA